MNYHRVEVEITGRTFASEWMEEHDARLLLDDVNFYNGSAKLCFNAPAQASESKYVTVPLDDMQELRKLSVDFIPPIADQATNDFTWDVRNWAAKYLSIKSAEPATPQKLVDVPVEVIEELSRAAAAANDLKFRDVVLKFCKTYLPLIVCLILGFLAAPCFGQTMNDLADRTTVEDSILDHRQSYAISLASAKTTSASIARIDKAQAWLKRKMKFHKCAKMEGNVKNDRIMTAYHSDLYNKYQRMSKKLALYRYELCIKLNQQKHDLVEYGVFIHGRTDDYLHHRQVSTSSLRHRAAYKRRRLPSH